MSQKELKRLKIIGDALGKRIKQREAAAALRMTDRHVRRLICRLEKEGECGMIHKSRGRPATNRISKRSRDKIIGFAGKKYEGFGPTLLQEKLEEIENEKVSRETLRKWLLLEGMEYRRRKKRPYRKWRERKHHKGQMVQMDGSHHDWFEGRGPNCVLMGYVDDATGDVFGRFYEYEGTIPALDSFRRYVSENGIPESVYLDRHTTYKSPARPSIDDELNDRKAQSQFERALAELGCRVIHANSPQAKGRIERLFGTFQDRVIKEMGLEKISTIDSANRFLEKYLPKYNKRFRVAPVEQADLHRKSPGYQELQRFLCIRDERTVRKDSTFSYEGKRYLIENKIYQSRVLIETRLDGRMIVRTKSGEFKYREIGTKEEVKPEIRVIPKASKERMKEKAYWCPHALNHRKNFEKMANPHGG